jgi:hypothetical protein
MAEIAEIRALRERLQSTKQTAELQIHVLLCQAVCSLDLFWTTLSKRNRMEGVLLCTSLVLKVLLMVQRWPVSNSRENCESDVNNMGVEN